MDGLIMTTQFILALSIMVGIHEWGHFITARMFGIRVEKFYIFFDFLFPFPNVANFTLFKKIKGDTEYGIGWFPLGGYVKIAGMIDESMDKKQMALPPQPDEFRAKPAWQRLIVMLGGIIMNIITGIVVFIALVYINGEKYLPASEAKYGIYANELAREIGLKTGDKVLEVNGKKVEKFDEIYGFDALLAKESYYLIERNGIQQRINLPANLLERLEKEGKITPFVEPLAPFEVGQVISGMPADNAGIQPGDKIVSINNEPVLYFQTFREQLAQYKSQTVTIVLERKGEQKSVQATIDENGKLGFAPKLLLNEASKKYSLLASIPKGTSMAFGVITTQLAAFGKMFRGELNPAKSLSGPVEIAQQFGTTWNWGRFWYLIGLLSMVLAFMNLLPIPALDGGHVIFLMYEMIARRKPSDKVLEISQQIGMVLLLSLMIFVIFKKFFLQLFAALGIM